MQREDVETFWWGELDKVIGWILVRIEYSAEGYRILVFKRGKKTRRVFIDFPEVI